MRARSGNVQARRLSPGVKLAYSALLIPTSMLHAPALSIIPALYAKYSAVSFTAIGLILILTRSLDAITDPLVGYFSDRMETGMGLRKPWITAGMFLCCLGELSRDYAERSSLAAYRTLSYFLGIALFLSLPLWPMFAGSEMTPEVTALASWLIVLSIRNADDS